MDEKNQIPITTLSKHNISVTKPVRDKIDRKNFLKNLTVGALASLLVPLTVTKVFGSKGNEKQWGMVINLRRCYGCKSCAVACKAEFDTRLGVFKSNVIEHEDGIFPNTTRKFLPWLCNHCSEPPCVDTCPVEPVKKSFNGASYDAKATYKRPDGPVLYDIDRCVGCHACVEACPYNARYIDPLLKAGEDSENNAIGKCTFCIRRVDAGKEPSCVNTCPGNARIFGDITDAGSEISLILKKYKNQVKTLRADFETAPNIFYIDLEENVYKHGVDIRNQAPGEWGQRRI